jgi:hypothetical protein
LFASAGFDGGCSAGAYQQTVKNMQKIFTSIHKPPASFRFAPIKHALAVTVEPFKFSQAEPRAYELSYVVARNLSFRYQNLTFTLDSINLDPLKIRTKYIGVIMIKIPSGFIVVFKTPKSADHTTRTGHRLPDVETRAVTYYRPYPANMIRGNKRS